MMEEWRDIEGYEGLYQVSNLGRIKALPRERAHFVGIMKPFVHGTNGYCYVNLRKDKKQSLHRVHKLVCKAFLDNPNNYPIINHKDEDKTNNSVENLEWCTHAHNNNYGGRIQRVVATRRKNSRPFMCLETGGVYKSQVECARELGIPRSKLCSVLHGDRNHTCGYHFAYIGGDAI